MTAYDDLVRSQHGHIRVTQAADVGIDTERLRRARQSGRLRQVHPRVLQVATAVDSERATLWRKRLEVAGPAAVEAARLLGFPAVPAPPQPQLVAPAAVVGPGCRGVRRVHDWDRRRFVEVDGLVVCDPADTVVDLARHFRQTRLRWLVQDLLNESRLTSPQLRARCRRGRSGSALTRQVLDELDDPMRSHAERRYVAALRAGDLPAPQVNLPVADESGAVVCELDAAWMWLRTVTEIDGWTYHRTLERVRRDIVKHTLVQTRLGCVLLRYLADAVLDDPTRAARHTGGVLRARAAELGVPLGRPSRLPRVLALPPA